MKKIILFLVLLSLMSCRKVPYVSCDAPSCDSETAQLLICGKWQLARTTFRNRLERKVEYKYKGDFPNYYLVFEPPESFKFYLSDTLIEKGKYRFIKEKDIAPTSNSERNLIIIESTTSFILDYVALFRICSDSLYLSFQSYASDSAPDGVWSKQ